MSEFALSNMLMLMKAFSWNEITDAQKVFFIIGCIAVGFTAIRIVLMLIGFIGVDGGDVDADVDADFDGDVGDADSFLDLGGVHFVTLNGAIVGLALGTWVGYFTAPVLPLWLCIVLTVIAVLVFMYLYALLMRAIYKLQNDGTLVKKNAVGKNGTVYLAIPPMRTGSGKVNVIVQGQYVELEAVTDENQRIPTGAPIDVVGITDEELLIVKPAGN